MSGNPNNLPGNAPKVKETKPKEKGMILELVEKAEESPKLLSQEEIDMALDEAKKEIEQEKLKVLFIMENAGKFLEIKNKFSKLGKIEDIKGIDIELADLFSKAEAKDLPNPQEVIFKEIIDDDVFKKERKEIEVNIHAIYKPDLKKTREESFDGGDGFFIKKGKNKEIGVLIDTEGHGETEAYKKFFMKKIFELLENVPDDKREEGIKKIDYFFENINHPGGKTAASYDRVIVEVEGDRKKVSAEFYGDAPFLVFDSDKNKFFHRGLGIKNSDSFSAIEKLEKNPKTGNIEDVFKEGFIGWGLTTPHTKDSIYEDSFSVDSQILMFSDGLADIRMKFEEGKNLEEVLNDFIKERESNKNLKLIEHIKKYLEKATNISDDITVVEVGAELK